MLYLLVADSLYDLTALLGVCRNKGCGGGAMQQAYKYILDNKGLDAEADYPYTATDGSPCWAAAAARRVADMANYTMVPVGQEAQLVAAAALGPVILSTICVAAIRSNVRAPAFLGFKSNTRVPPP